LGNYAVTTGPDGTAQVFKINSSELSYQGKGLDSIHECCFNNQSFEDFPIAPPKQMIRSSRINYAAFEPCAITHSGDVPIRRLAGIQSSTLYLYDIPSSRVIGSETMGSNHLNKVHFSNHAPFGQLLAFCGQDSSIGIVDTRLLQGGSKSLVWSIADAHQGQVNDIMFNHFVPFWIASAGEDGVVKMWDIRYLKNPAARIDAHYGSIRSIGWSNTHCNVLSTVSHDRSWRSWYIDGSHHTAKHPWKEFMIGCPGSEYESLNQMHNMDSSVIGGTLIGDYSLYEAPVIATQAAAAHADTFYSLSALGTLSAHTIKSRVLEGLFEHRYESNFEKEVETAVHNRDLAEAFELMIKLSRTEFSKNENIASHEGPLIQLCTMRNAIGQSEWKLGDLNSLSMEEVKKDLDDFTYGLPPGFGEFQQWHKLVPDYLQIQFDLVQLRHQIVSEIKKGNWEIIVEKEKKILTGMEIDDEFLDIQTIELIVKTTLLHNFMKGLSIGLGMGQLLADIPKFNFESLSNIMSLLVYPTVYDTHDWILDKDMELMKQDSNTRQLYVQKYVEYRAAKAAVANPVAMLLNSRQRTNTGPKEPVSLPAMSRKANEDEDVKSPKKMIKSIVGDGKAALPMVSLEMRMLKLIENPPEEFNEEVIRIMQNVLTDSGVSGNRYRGAVVPFERTISLITNKLYLNALMESKRFEEYFGVAYNLIVVCLIN
jgi:WD40 repeat protein